MDDHVTPAELDGFIFGRLSKERGKAVVLHLLRGCELCKSLIEPYLPALFGSRNRFHELPPPLQSAYDDAMDRTFASLGLRVPRKTLEEAKQEILDLLASRGLDALNDAPPDTTGIPTVEALLERSWSFRFEDPAKMIELARAATIAADNLDERELGIEEAEDFRCRAWTELANAYRVADELGNADDAFGPATLHLLKSTQNNLLAARFFTVFGSQNAARRHFDIANTAFEIAVNLYHKHGDEHLTGRALIVKGITVGYSGDTEQALLNIRQGLQLVDEGRDPGLILSALQNQVRFLVDCGRFRDALLAFWEVQRLGLSIGGQTNLLKVRWLEGQIRAGLNELDRAERALTEVRQGFEEAGLGYKAALAGLELGAVWLRQGRGQEAERAVLECAAVFLSLQIRRELHASVLVLEMAAKMRTLNLATLQDIIGRLRKAEQDPHAPAPDQP